MKKLLFILVFILFFIPNAFGAKVYLKSDRSVVDLNETFSISIVMEDCSGDAELPDVDGLKVLSTYTSSSINIINGSMSKVKEIGFSVLPVKEGIIEIPSFSVKTDKGNFSTNVLRIRVEKGEALKAVPGRDHIFFKSFLSSDKIFTGQKIFYKVIIYSDDEILKLGFRDPSFKNFTAKRLPDKQYTKIVAGKAYSVNEITFGLTPLKVAKGEIEPASIEARIAVRSGRKSNDPFFNDPFFSSSFTNTRRKLFATKPLPYEIKALPKTDSTAFPVNITGKIKAHSSIDRKEMDINDSITYKIEIEGEGNLSSAKFPDLISPEGIKIYKDKLSSRLSDEEGIEKGVVSQNYAVVASRPGDFKIPGFKIRYFDPEVEKWKEIYIENQPFKVNGDKVKSAISSNSGEISNENKEKKVPSLSGKIKNGVKTSDEISDIKNEKGSFLSSKPDYRRFFILYIIIFIVCLTFLLFRYLRKNYLESDLRLKKVYLKELKNIISGDQDNIKKIENVKAILNKASMDIQAVSFDSLIDSGKDRLDSDFILKAEKFLKITGSVLFSQSRTNLLEDPKEVLSDAEYLLKEILNV